VVKYDGLGVLGTPVLKEDLNAIFRGYCAPAPVGTVRFELESGAASAAGDGALRSAKATVPPISKARRTSLIL
jgi:hypothetical protein